MNEDDAARVCELAVESIRCLGKMLDFIGNDDGGLAGTLRRAAGELIGEIDVRIIVPLSELHPGLDDIA